MCYGDNGHQDFRSTTPGNHPHTEIWLNYTIVGQSIRREAECSSTKVIRRALKCDSCLLYLFQNKNKIAPALTRMLERCTECLRQVVTERGQEHVFDRLGCAAQPCPGTARNVGVLRSPLNSAFGPVVHLNPETDGAFGDRPRVPGAIAERPWVKSATRPGAAGNNLR